MNNQPPFPGMDPYVEARHLWKGIHTQLIGELSTHLLPPLLAPGYYVDVEPSLQVRSDQMVYPDLQVLAAHRAPGRQPATLALAVAEATMSLTTFPETVEEEEETAIFIREAASEQLVTVVEILSHSNKSTGADKRARYLTKRRDLIQSGVHLVEVDLLRAGQRIVAGLPDQPYHILVTRADQQPQGRVWSFGFEQSIPTAPIPLIAPDEQAPLPLQEAFSAIYWARNFGVRIDYNQDPEPPLTEAQRVAIHKRLVAQKRRLHSNGHLRT